jgi:3'-phosphoadenosine 5'-phosphosulfate sulfotransferase (PAPS reductase)/FAD synthetase
MASAPQELFGKTTARNERHNGAAAPAEQKLSHLKTLEAESIYILREAAAEFSRPVMLYSIGKDSSVMLRLAQKAFYPGKIPFPLLHVDTSYKFPEMIEFRDEYTKQIGAELIVRRNQEALDAGANPFSLGTQKCCGLLKTKSLLNALAEGGFNAAFGGARRDEEKSRAKERIYSFRDVHGQWDPKSQRPGALEYFQFENRQGREHPNLPPIELDGAGRLAVYPHGKHPNCTSLFRAGTPSRGAGRRNRPDLFEGPASFRGKIPPRSLPHEVAWLRALHRSHPLGRRYRSQNH